jgi:Fe-S cluster assembly protein SufD
LADADGAAAPSVVEPDWLDERRDRAKTVARSLELPGPKQKGWEFTDLSGLDIGGFAEGVATVDGLAATNGSGPVVMPLAQAAAKLPDLVSARFGTVVANEDPFVARNESAWRDGVFVHVPREQRLDDPVRLTIAGDGDVAINWRALIVLEEGAEAEVWERYTSDGAGLFNGVVELVVGQGANLRYVCQQDLDERSWVFATQRAEVERDASLEWVALGFGSARGKVRMETKLAGRG